MPHMHSAIAHPSTPSLHYRYEAQIVDKVLPSYAEYEARAIAGALEILLEEDEYEPRATALPPAARHCPATRRRPARHRV